MAHISVWFNIQVLGYIMVYDQFCLPLLDSGGPGINIDTSFWY